MGRGFAVIMRLLNAEKKKNKSIKEKINANTSFFLYSETKLSLKQETKWHDLLQNKPFLATRNAYFCF